MLSHPKNKKSKTRVINFTKRPLQMPSSALWFKNLCKKWKNRDQNVLALQISLSILEKSMKNIN